MRRLIILERSERCPRSDKRNHKCIGCFEADTTCSHLQASLLDAASAANTQGEGGLALWINTHRFLAAVVRVQLCKVEAHGCVLRATDQFSQMFSLITSPIKIKIFFFCTSDKQVRRA